MSGSQPGSLQSVAPESPDALDPGSVGTYGVRGRLVLVRAERWQSGRSRPPRKREYLYGYREFESPPLRQISRSGVLASNPLWFLRLAEFESCNLSNGSLSDIRNSPPFQDASLTSSRSNLRCSAGGCSRNKIRGAARQRHQIHGFADRSQRRCLCGS